MRILLAMALCFASLSSWSHEHKDMDKMMDSMSFEDAKKMKTQMLDKKASMITEAQTCVNAAKDKHGLKACMKKMHDEKSEMRERMKDKKKKY